MFDRKKKRQGKTLYYSDWEKKVQREIVKEKQLVRKKNKDEEWQLRW